MGNLNEYKFLTMDKATCHGAVRIDGTRIAVWMIAHDYVNGSTPESIKKAYSISDEVLEEVDRFIILNRIEGYKNVADRRAL